MSAPVEWDSVTWGAYVWDFVVNATPRRGAFHPRVDPRSYNRSSNLIVPGQAPEHLDAADGRYWLRLEWRALARALRESGEQRNLAVREALAFRQARHMLYPAGVESESAIEITDGLAAYTATVVVARSAADAIASALDLLAASEEGESFVRTFAYASGPRMVSCSMRRLPAGRGG